MFLMACVSLTSSKNKTTLHKKKDWTQNMAGPNYVSRYLASSFYLVQTLQRGYQKQQIRHVWLVPLFPSNSYHSPIMFGLKNAH